MHNIENIKNYCINIGTEFVSTEYRTVKDNYKFKCSECGEIFIQRYDVLKRNNNTKCEKCKGFVKWDLEKVRVYCKNNNSEFLSDNFKTIKDTYEFLCSECKSHIIKTTFKTFYSKDKNFKICEVCSGKTKWNYEKVIEKCKELGIEFLSKEYKNIRTKYKFKCKQCNEVFESTFNDVLYENKLLCKKCSLLKRGKNRQKWTEEYIKEYFSYKFNEIEIIKISRTKKVNLILKCKKCLNIFKVELNHFINDDRCRSCEISNISKGEFLIEKFLIENNINYKREHTFEDLKYIKKLRIDFLILNNNQSPMIAIEFNGKQHYEPVKYYGGKQYFSLIKKRDAIKKRYLENKNINLVIIKYNDIDNIEKILRKELFC